MVVRFFTPRRTSARIKFSGIPHSPKPPIMMVAPSGMSRIASSELATSLFIAQIVKQVRFHHGDTLRLGSGQAPARRNAEKATERYNKLRCQLRESRSAFLAFGFLRDPVSPW